MVYRTNDGKSLLSCSSFGDCGHLLPSKPSAWGINSYPLGRPDLQAEPKLHYLTEDPSVLALFNVHDLGGGC
eukprot:1139855-Pelagomonas_calceolata.AAC.2